MRYDNDVAVLKFSQEEEAKFPCVRGLIWPACWPQTSTDYSYWPDTWASGWGRTDPASNAISTVLRKVQLVPVSWDKCRLLMGESRITEGMICAVAAGKDTCNVSLSVRESGPHGLTILRETVVGRSSLGDSQEDTASPGSPPGETGVPSRTLSGCMPTSSSTWTGSPTNLASPALGEFTPYPSSAVQYGVQFKSD